jgi:hypothetical protein
VYIRKCFSSSALNLDFRLRIGSQTMRADNRRFRSGIEHSGQMDPSTKRSNRAVESIKREGENPLLRREASLARRRCTSRIPALPRTRVLPAIAVTIRAVHREVFGKE